MSARAQQTTALVYTAGEPRIGAALILAHGAGAGQHSPVHGRASLTRWLRLGARPRSRSTSSTPNGSARSPDRAPALEACYRAVIDRRARSNRQRATRAVHRRQVDGRPHCHAGRAPPMPRLPVAGLVLLGYPLHPPGQPDRLSRRAPARRERGRCCSCREAATRSARHGELAPILAAASPDRPTMHRWTAGIIRSS